MALIVEFALGTPILRTAANAIRELRLEEVHGTETGRPKLLFWAFGDEFEPFEEALASDSTIEAFTTLEEAPDRHLYSVVLSESAAERLTYPVAAEYGVAILEIIVTDETIVCARVPSRDALLAYRDRCLERDVGFSIRRIYRPEAPAREAYGVTDPQCKALRAALEAGYFEVPRETTLSSLAATLGISDQALSARLRRGQANLLEATLADHG